LIRHPKVIGVAVCGSLVRGDLWEHSDLDLFAVMRGAGADWHALTVRHGDVKVHLQILSEEFLVSKSEGFRGGVVSQVLALSEVVYDPEGIFAKGLRELVAYPKDSQVHNTVKHLISFLAAYNRARKCAEMDYVEDAFLNTTLAFRDLAQMEYARRGLYPQRTIMDELSGVSPHTYNTYVWFIYGRKNVGERIRRSFAFFESMLDEILADIGPPLMAAIRAHDRPLTGEGIGQIPAIYDRSADLEFLLERLVERGIIREDHRTLEIEGISLDTLSETLFDLV